MPKARDASEATVAQAEREIGAIRQQIGRMAPKRRD
jgi:hypothetical protein